MVNPLWVQLNLRLWTCSLIKQSAWLKCGTLHSQTGMHPDMVKGNDKFSDIALGVQSFSSNIWHLSFLPKVDCNSAGCWRYSADSHRL